MIGRDHERHYEKWRDFIRFATQSDLTDVGINGKALPRWKNGVFPSQKSVKKLPRLFGRYGLQINMDMARAYYVNLMRDK